VLAATFALLATVFLAAGVRTPARARTSVTVARLSTMDSREAALSESGARPLWERLIHPVLASLAPRLRPRWAGLSERELRRAGIDPGRFGLGDLLAIKVVGAIAGAALVLGLATMTPGILILMPAVSFGCFLAPSIAVRRRRVARQRQMQRELPDLIGLLKAFVTAGIPMEQALHLISAQQSRCATGNLLADEIRQALSDYGLGLTIDRALDAMAQRVGLEELELLASALAQGKRQGAGMERILRDQETVVRLQQRNRAAAEASRVGNLLVGVLVLVYLPEFMVLIMVPLFYGIFLRAFS